MLFKRYRELRKRRRLMAEASPMDQSDKYRKVGKNTLQEGGLFAKDQPSDGIDLTGKRIFTLARLRELITNRRNRDRIDIESEDNGFFTTPERDGFFSPGRWKARVANRRKFRVAVSGNRKWIFIGIAVVAVCGTIVYLSMTYGGSIAGLLL